jgi:putative spermidine/putrescine transport system ATP-binding protein
MTYLEIKNVSKSFTKGSNAVEDFNLQVDRGELVSFLGPSGCGKTTTLRMVAGFEIPTNGNVFIDGQDVTHVSPNQRKVGMVFQAYALFPNMTVEGNIGFGMKIAKKPADETKSIVEEMLKLIDMEGYGKRYPYQLSGGQQQRVALARALAIHPSVLLLDEPLSALDAKIRVQLRAEIRSIQRKLGITTVYVTHDQEEALSISDRIVVMYQGKIEQVGSPFQIYNFPQTGFVAGFVGTLNTTTAEVIDPDKKLLQLDGLQLQTAEDLSGFHAGDKVPIAVRPERFTFAAHEKKANVLDCTIDNITFLGSVVRVQVTIGNEQFYMDTFNNPFLALPKVGDTDQISCSREAVLILRN